MGGILFLWIVSTLVYTSILWSIRVIDDKSKMDWGEWRNGMVGMGLCWGLLITVM